MTKFVSMVDGLYLKSDKLYQELVWICFFVIIKKLFNVTLYNFQSVIQRVRAYYYNAWDKRFLIFYA